MRNHDCIVCKTEQARAGKPKIKVKKKKRERTKRKSEGSKLRYLLNKSLPGILRVLNQKIIINSIWRPHEI